MHDPGEPNFCVYEVRPGYRPSPRPLGEHEAAALYGIHTDAQWLATKREMSRLIRALAIKAGELPEPGSIGAFSLMVRSIVRDAVVPRALQVKASKRRPVMECYRG